MKKFLILAALCVLATLSANQRLQQRHSYAVNYTYQNDDFFYFHRWVNETPVYLPGQPDVLHHLDIENRLLDWDGSDTGWQSLDPIMFYPAVYHNQTGRLVCYYNTPQGGYRFEQYDQEGRLVSLRRYLISEGDLQFDSTLRYFYGNHSSPDSTYSSWFNGAGIHYYYKILPVFDPNGVKLEEYRYDSGDSLTWFPYRHTTLFHRNESLPDGFQYRLHNPVFELTWSGMASASVNFYQPGLYGRAMVEALTVDYYENGNWVPQEQHDYTYNLFGGEVGISITAWDLDMMHIPDYFPAVYNYSFSAEGYFLGQEWYIDTGLEPPTWGDISYVWEPMVAANDPQPPVPALAEIQAWPNPFSAEAELRIDIDKLPADALLSVYNLRGQLLRSLTLDTVQTGKRSAKWDGRDGGGKPCPSGVYLLRVRSTGKDLARGKAVLAR